MLNSFKSVLRIDSSAGITAEQINNAAQKEQGQMFADLLLEGVRAEEERAGQKQKKHQSRR